MVSEFRTWSDLRVFLAVCRAGSTLAAARALGMAQPTVARRIDALEHELGLVLFDRDTCAFHPTDAARALLPLAEAAEAAAASILQKATDLSRARPIRVTALNVNFSEAVFAIFNDFSQLHPDVIFEFLADTRTLDLMSGAADVALRISFGDEHPDLVCRPVSTARFTLYGSSRYAARHGLPRRLEEMAGHILHCLLRPGLAQTIRPGFLKYVSESQISRTTAEFNLIHAAVRAGEGLRIINLRLAAQDEAAGRLIRCFEPPEELDGKHQILVSPEAYRRPELRAFTAFSAPRYGALFK